MLCPHKLSHMCNMTRIDGSAAVFRDIAEERRIGAYPYYAVQLCDGSDLLVAEISALITKGTATAV